MSTGFPGDDAADTTRAPDGPAPEVDEAADGAAGAVDVATRGRDAVLGREVAMVTLHPVHGDDLAARTERVRRLAALHHAHLVEVFDVDGLVEGAEGTLVLQSVAGRSLDTRTDRSRWASTAVAEIGAQVASALDHAHARGVVHGGIGPASIVVGGTDAAPFAWLTGFTAALHHTPEHGSAPGLPGLRDPAAEAGDVAALGEVLGQVLDPGSLDAPTLELTLTEMATARVAAREAAERLARITEALRLADDDRTELVTLTPAASPLPVAPTVVAAGRAAVAPAGSTLTAAAPATSLSRGSRRGLAGRGLQVALLGGAALSVAAASGLVLWASESQPAPVGVGPTGASAPVVPPAAAPATTERSTRSSTDDRTVDETTSRAPALNPPAQGITTLPPTTTTTTPIVPPPVTVPPTTTTTTTTTTTRPPGPTANDATLAAP